MLGDGEDMRNGMDDAALGTCSSLADTKEP